MVERIFLERQSYRKRRMMDAVRLLPVLGLALWMVPLMWPAVDLADRDTSLEAMPTSNALFYLFIVWTSLVVAAWLLWRHTRVDADKPKNEEPGQ